jgi:hypothetical protein
VDETASEDELAMMRSSVNQLLNEPGIAWSVGILTYGERIALFDVQRYDHDEDIESRVMWRRSRPQRLVVCPSDDSDILDIASVMPFSKFFASVVFPRHHS